jgi:hypothetical protein
MNLLLNIFKKILIFEKILFIEEINLQILNKSKVNLEGYQLIDVVL